MNRIRTLTTIALLVVVHTMVLAQQPATNAPRTYTKENPLVYEDVRDLWPYSFLNANGEPDGFNVELVRMILNELGIPYVIRMNESLDVFNDLKAGRADLTMALSAGFHDAYGHYSENSVTLFTQSIVSPKSKPSTVHNLHDLATQRVYVRDNSFTHHLMIDYGWGDNAIPTRAVGSILQKMSTEEEGQLVWNTLSLKWLLAKFHLDNLQIQPVNMPHGEYKFMSNDNHLLQMLDEKLTELSSADKLTPLNNRWFYPERHEQHGSPWAWYLGGGTALLVLILLLYALSYRLQASRITAGNNRLNRRLALIMETMGVRVWTYNLTTQQFTWRNEFGQPAFVYSREEFAQRYSPEDFARLDEVFNHLATTRAGNGNEEEETTLRIKAQDAREDGDTEMHDFIITLSVLHRDKTGQPTLLIGTKKDVTKKNLQLREAEERTLRYWAMFNTPIVGIMLFDSNGLLSNINQKACEMFGCNREQIIAEHPAYGDLFFIDLPMNQANGFHATLMAHYDRMPLEERKVKSVRRTEKLFNEYHLMTIDHENGSLLGMFAFCTDATFAVESQENEMQKENELKEALSNRDKYVRTIDEFIRNSNVRIVSYSPSSHVFTIYKDSREVQHALTPIRLMTLVDNRQRIRAMHIIDKMDNRDPAPIDIELRTTLRLRGRLTLCLHIHLLPQLGTDGRADEYQGVLRDISQLKATEQQLADVEAKTQEVEDTKTTFIRNMMREIHTPLDSIISEAAELTTDSNSTTQVALRQDIVDNAEHLTHVIDNILYLSRLEANMVEFTKRPTDFAMLFGQECRQGWYKDQKPEVRYVVENPYEQLVIDIDAEHLGNVIQQLTRNAAQNTDSGVVHTRYDYIGRRLIISIDDTGQGIPPKTLAKLNNDYVRGIHTSVGMGLAICKELLRQMGGHLEITSELGLGTTIWVMLPCEASHVKRKKDTITTKLKELTQ